MHRVVYIYNLTLNSIPGLCVLRNHSSNVSDDSPLEKRTHHIGYIPLVHCLVELIDPWIGRLEQLIHLKRKLQLFRVASHKNLFAEAWSNVTCREVWNCRNHGVVRFEEEHGKINLHGVLKRRYFNFDCTNHHGVLKHWQTRELAENLLGRVSVIFFANGPTTRDNVGGGKHFTLCTEGEPGSFTDFLIIRENCDVAASWAYPFI
jgi:hypothetical protein